MTTAQSSIDAYLKSLPEDRRAAVTVLRKLVLSKLPKGYEESFSFGMLTYEVPLSVYPDTYNKKPLLYLGLASQKSHLALYLCNVYAESELKERVEKAFRAAGKKLDMGKSCMRFQRLEDIELGVVAEVVGATPMAEFVARAKAVHSPEARAKRSAERSVAKQKATPAKPAAKKKKPTSKSPATSKGTSAKKSAQKASK